MAKMGRPKVEEPLTHRVSVRFSDKTYKRLKAYAESNCRTMSEVLKEGLDLIYEKNKKK